MFTRTEIVVEVKPAHFQNEVCPLPKMIGKQISMKPTSVKRLVLDSAIAMKRKYSDIKGHETLSLG